MKLFGLTVKNSNWYAQILLAKLRKYPLSYICFVENELMGSFNVNSFVKKKEKN